MSLINFLNPKLKPSVECDAVCEDGYSAANLIADDCEQLSRGFMAFSVTKPPIEIVFEFPKAIDLKVIKLWNSIGSLRSSAFEVHGKYEGIWERVAFVRDLAKGVDSATFCYQSDYNSRSNTSTEAAEQQCEKVFFFKTAHKILSSTNSIKITIRATQKCPPVLRKVQVWGLPSRVLDKADRELVKTIWSEITNPNDQNTHAQHSGQRSPSRYVPELNEHSTLEIPEEFLDAITWELMIFPTVLPSGKVVDQSTIDKHSEVEARWGRLPSDPFTGLEFTSQRKAILNLGLKARIEKFLMEKANHFKTVPRSLGSSRVRRSKNRHASQFASLCQKHSSSVGAYSSLSASTYKTTSATCTLSSEATTPPAKRAKLNNSTTSSSSSSSSSTTTTTTTRRIDISEYTTTKTSHKSATSTVSYSEVSSDSATASSSTSASTSATSSSIGTATAAPSSIDLAIQQALQKITRFTRPPPVETVQQASCVRCKSEHFSYEISTCKHLVCRKCLVQLSQEKMCTCKTTFRNIDVERYHKL